MIRALASFGRRADRTVDGFARAHGVPLDDETRRFLSFHLARMRWHRQVGGIVGLVIGIALPFVVPGGFLVTCVSVLGGSVLGMAAAELARWFGPSDRPQRIASLTPRSRSTFVIGESAWLDRLMIGLLVASGAGAIWLLVAAAPDEQRVVLGGAPVLDLPTGAHDIALQGTATAVDVAWRTAEGSARSTTVTWPAGVGSGASSMGVEPRHPTAQFVVGLFALLTAAWAFGEWRRVSRVAFVRSTAPARRPSRMPA